jgi:DNA-directed RNA polymerase specialized sigma24 family protein
VNKDGFTHRGDDDSLRLAELARKASGGSTSALHELRRTIRFTEKDVARQFASLKSVHISDAADLAFIDAVRSYRPGETSFITWFRRIFKHRLIEAVRPLRNKLEITSADEYVNSIEDRSEIYQIGEQLADQKEFVVMAVAYLSPVQIRSLQAALLGISWIEAGRRAKVSPQMISNGWRGLMVFAHIYERGEVPWPPTDEAINEVRKKIKVEISPQKRRRGRHGRIQKNEI